MRRWILLVTFGIASTLIQPARAQSLVPSENSSAVSFDLASGFLVVVEGQAGDVGGLKFIIDTGATHSVINPKVARTLGLKRHASRVMNFDRAVPIESGELHALQVGPLRAENLQVTVADLSQYTEFAKGIDGIIGLDLLSQTQKFTIDYANKKLYFEVAANAASHPTPSCFVVPVIVQGTTLWMVVDTGLAQIVLYKNRLKEGKVNIRAEGGPKAATMGRIQGTEVSLPGVRIGGPEKMVTAILIDGPTDIGMSGLDGYLGTGSLHASWIEFDFAKMALRLQ